MSKTPFSCVLSDDKSEMKLVAQAGEFKYSAAEVEELAHFFGELRAQMLPALSDQSDDVTREGDLWEAYKKPQDGSARIYFRQRGLGWSFIQLEEDRCIELAGVLDPRLQALQNQ
jgi:hypothetical protein